VAPGRRSPPVRPAPRRSSRRWRPCPCRRGAARRRSAAACSAAAVRPQDGDDLTIGDREAHGVRACSGGPSLDEKLRERSVISMLARSDSRLAAPSAHEWHGPGREQESASADASRSPDAPTLHGASFGPRPTGRATRPSPIRTVTVGSLPGDPPAPRIDADVGSWAGFKRLAPLSADHRSGLPPDPEGEAICVMCPQHSAPPMRPHRAAPRQQGAAAVVVRSPPDPAAPAAYPARVPDSIVRPATT
jgi:hypothetical protein